VGVLRMGDPGGVLARDRRGHRVGRPDQDQSNRATQPMMFSGDETCDVGNETGSSVSDDYTAETSEFNGTINWVQLDQGADDHDHLITPEQRLAVAMARQ